MKTKSRRDFLRNSLLGLSGATILPNSLKNLRTVNAPGEMPALPARILGRTGIQTPLISMGTAGATSAGFVRAAYESGVKLFFSANYYGEGNNEILVGDALRKLPRDSFYIGTASIPDEIDTRTGLLPKSFSAESYMKKTEESLKRFGIEYIDFVLLPFAGKKETVLNEAVLKTFEQVKKQGKARFTGIISHSDTEEALNAATGSGVYDVAMIGYNFKSQNLESMNATIARAVNAGIGILGMKAQAGSARQGQSFNSDAALKWVLQNENVASIVSGMTSLDELNKNIAMLGNLKLSEQELKYLKTASVLSPDDLYCRQCGQCVPQCPHNIDIPTIMRSYMYAYGYKNTKHARYTLSSAIADNPCKDCGSCNVNCASGFDIRNKILDIARLNDVPQDFLHV